MITIGNASDLASHFGQVQVPPGKVGSAEVREFVYRENDPWPLPTPRPRPGTYSMLLRDGEGWMTSLPHEIHEAMPLFNAMNRAPRNSPMVILGLGLGLYLRAAMLLGHKGPIDVVEIDADVMALVSPHWAEMAQIARCDVRFHLADAYTWPEATVGRWAIGYADIWRDMTPDNLPHIERLASVYAPRCLWYESWSRQEGEAILRRDRA